MVNVTLRGVVRGGAAKRCTARLVLVTCAAFTGCFGCNPVIERAPWSADPSMSAGTSPRCGDLRPWIALASTSPEHVVIDGADGFVGYAPQSIGIFGVDGKYAPRIRLTVPFPRGVTLPVQTLEGGATYDTQKTWIVKARASAQTLAVLTHCQHSRGYCGTSVYFSDRPSFSVDALFGNRPLRELDISSTFPTYYGGFALDSAGRTVLASHVAALSGSSAARIQVKKLDAAHSVLAEASLPLGADEKAHVLDIQVDASDRVALLYALRPATAVGAAPLAPGNRLALLGADLQPLAEWTAPANVTVRALAFDGRGRLWVAGGIEQSGVTRSWLDQLDANALMSVRLVPSIGSLGVASALDVRQDGGLWLAGVGKTEQTAWLERYGPEGTAIWPYRSELTTNGYFLVNEDSSLGHFEITGVAEQADGSVLVSSTSTYRYEPGTPLTFPPNAAPPTSCSEQGNCDCSRRGWEP